MELRTFQYIIEKGWNVQRFPELDSKQTLVLVFAAPEFLNLQEPIHQLRNYYKNSKMIGCSSAGEILGPNIFDKSLTVVVIKLKDTPIKIVKAEVNKVEDSFTAGESISRQLRSADLKNIFVLSEGLHVNGSELVNGLNAALTDTKPLITGGLAGDNSYFNKTWTLFDGEILKNHIVAVGFYGDHIHVGHASKGGWDIFGPARRITRSERNILYELDNQPALALYKEYLGDRAAELPASGLLYPLAIKDMRDKDSISLVRTILGVDEKKQALIFAGDMPLGYHAQLMRANFDRLITSASEAGELAGKRILKPAGRAKDGPILAISISCVGRRLLLGERTEEETESTLDSLPANSTQVGFYSYGELSPAGVGDCKLHNQTMTLTTYFES
ncbi:FIST signal transduction protein [Legionella cardiaca]|uniref:FIST N-terminal domain-containing protein n=1 Tax=Legionella cardiaca TaxID=1071983 RepID=A0ABY8AST3_9GAMM|nr:FIST N-terminal domain-containing protein [Legionella cardiaca]WED43573.1 FIST N-terminal domain-containing protein [Legionella cardiaca]